MKTVNEVFSAYPNFKSKFDEQRLALALENAEAKMQAAIDYLNKLIEDNNINHTGLYVGHSGGKDSVVAHYVAKMAVSPLLPVVHTSKVPGEANFTHPRTVEFLYYVARYHHTIFRPLESEVHPPLPYKVQIDGTRMLEAERSDGRSTDLVFDNKVINRRYMQGYNPSGLFHKQFLYPIYDWTDTEVWAAIFAFNLPFSAEYHEVEWVAES